MLWGSAGRPAAGGQERSRTGRKRRVCCSRMKIGSIIDLPVIAMKEGTHQGRVVDAVIDAENNAVSHYLISKDSKYDLLLVNAADVAGVGGDYMVVQDAGEIRRVFGDPKRMETVSRGFYLADATAVSAAGTSLGKVADFDLDVATGQIQSLILTDGQQFPADGIIAMSGTTVFVDTPGAKRASKPQAQRQTPPPEPETERAERAETPAEPREEKKRRRGDGTPNAVPVQAQRAYQGVSPADALRDFSSSSQPPASSPSVKVNFRRMLIGKKMARDVVSDDGVFKANEGDTITEWMVQLAEQHNALQLLMKHVEPS